MAKEEKEGSRDPKKKVVDVQTADVLNEQTIVATALVDDEWRRSLLKRIPVDHFQVREHQSIWTVLSELERQKRSFEVASAVRLSAGAFTDEYLRELIGSRAEVPDDLSSHIQNLFFDKARQIAVKGPISALLDALREPKTPPERVRALAAQVAQCFEGHGDRRYLYDSERLIADQMAEIRSRIKGHAVYPYGLEGLDYDETGKRRIIPGAAPGQVTVVTAVPGAGKTTVGARMVLGLARQRRRVLVGAWEVKAGLTLELLAVMALGWNRSELLDPETHTVDGELAGVFLTEERLAQLETTMRRISKWVTFMGIPFNRIPGERGSNDANLDLIQGYIADSGCDVFVADLWKRCLRRADPEEEEQALIRQQAMAEELSVHCILMQQQRLKDIEARVDKKPTREGIKGSGAWIEVADTIIGIHRPGLWKNVEDNTVELDVLKQRWGKWPIAVEFAWNGDMGSLTSGKTVRYDSPGERSETEVDGDLFVSGNGKGKGRR